MSPLLKRREEMGRGGQERGKCSVEEEAEEDVSVGGHPSAACNWALDLRRRGKVGDAFGVLRAALALGPGRALLLEVMAAFYGPGARVWSMQPCGCRRCCSVMLTWHFWPGA